MLILFTPTFKWQRDTVNKTSYISDISNKSEIDRFIKDIFMHHPNFNSLQPITKIQRLNETNCYTITVLPTIYVSNIFLDVFSESWHIQGVKIDDVVIDESTIRFDVFNYEVDLTQLRQRNIERIIRDRNIESIIFKNAATNITNVTLFNTAFVHTNYSGVYFENSSLLRSLFNDALLITTFFINCKLNGSQFQNADLRLADFTRADLRPYAHKVYNRFYLGYQTEYVVTNFQDADLRKASLEGAQLNNANLDNADLRGIKFNNNTVLTNCSTVGTKFSISDEIALTNQFGAELFQEAIFMADDIDTEPEPEPAPVPLYIEGLAFEIHNAFNKINMVKYMEIMNDEINDDNINEYKQDIVSYIIKSLQSKSYIR